jgi:glycosyltransferase involved in cell wall biosynthesis
MPFLNEGNWPYKTVQSIYDTADNNLFEIIAIDDCSKDTYDFSKYPDVRFIRNTKRLGVDESRQLGVEMAITPNCMVLDSHELFYPNSNWLNKVIDTIKSDEKSIWCYTCNGLWTGEEDIYNHKGHYYAADLKLFTEKEKDRPCRQILEPTWTTKKPELEQVVQVILGANYGFTKEWFLYLHGLKGLMSWGSSEPFLSIKSHLAGGSCKIRTDIETCHLFRQNSPYSTGILHLIFNKLYLLKTIFPKELEEKLMKYIPNDINLTNALKIIEQNKDEIERERQYYKSIFKHDIYWLCNKFNIEIPR